MKPWQFVPYVFISPKLSLEYRCKKYFKIENINFKEQTQEIQELQKSCNEAQLHWLYFRFGFSDESLRSGENNSIS